MLQAAFYDIESFLNAFSLALWQPNSGTEEHPDHGILSIFLLTDNDSRNGKTPLNPWDDSVFRKEQERALRSRVKFQNPSEMENMVQNHVYQTFKEALTERIFEKNKNIPKDIEVRLYNLAEFSANDLLFRIFGLSDAYMMNTSEGSLPWSFENKNGTHFPTRYRLVCDTDSDFAEKSKEGPMPYLIGYNSLNYDTTMLALYENGRWRIREYIKKGVPKFECIYNENLTAEEMREHNDNLFSDEFKSCMSNYLMQEKNPHGIWVATQGGGWSDPRNRIRQNMLRSGRYIDLAQINEKQSRVGLKRLCGMQGGQILESEKLSQNQKVIESIDELIDMLAYNVSDVVTLDMLLFRDKYYQAQITVKQNLLKTYPELIYEKKQGEYAPDVSPDRVRRDRLRIDSSSAKFATMCLCPYGHIKDIPAVSFKYPAPGKVKELGMTEQMDVLEMAKDFFYRNFPQPELRAQFDELYNYYNSIQGKNFNDTDNYIADYRDSKNPEDRKNYHPCSGTPERRSIILPYFRKDGSETSCFVNFSIGGIHGAEANMELYQTDYAAWQKEMDKLRRVQELYPAPTDLRAAKTVELDGVTYKYNDFLKSGATKIKAEYKDIASKKPQLYITKNGLSELNGRYTKTSAGLTRHQDFESYYPNLLRMMEAFNNQGLGYDPYAEIFKYKQEDGVNMTDQNRSATERAYYKDMREGTKLILNSASGAANAKFASSIRVDNQILSMRMIGQLFSWMIGQAQALEGADIYSTNTDGLYAHMELPGLTPEENVALSDAILEKNAKDIHVNITPEPVFLISKDTNNRLDIDPETGSIDGASGGDVACRKGPMPTKALAHPAAIDWMLSEYLKEKAMGDDPELSKPFDTKLGESLFEQLRAAFSKKEALRMFQNILASSPGSFTYIVIKNSENAPAELVQHYNRVFIMKDSTPGCVHLTTVFGKKVTPAMRNKRKKDKEPAVQHNSAATAAFAGYGVYEADIPPETEMVFKKINGIDPSWFMRIENRALDELSEEEQGAILDNLDRDKYVGLLKDKYENNWRNHLPGEPEEETSPEEPKGLSLEEDLLQSAMAALNAAAPQAEQTVSPKAQTVSDALKIIEELEAAKSLPADQFMKKSLKLMDRAKTVMGQMCSLLQEGEDREKTETL